MASPPDPGGGSGEDPDRNAAGEFRRCGECDDGLDRRQSPPRCCACPRGRERARNLALGPPPGLLAGEARRADDLAALDGAAVALAARGMSRLASGSRRVPGSNEDPYARSEAAVSFEAKIGRAILQAMEARGFARSQVETLLARLQA